MPASGPHDQTTHPVVPPPQHGSLPFSAAALKAAAGFHQQVTSHPPARSPHAVNLQDRIAQLRSHPGLHVVRSPHAANLASRKGLWRTAKPARSHFPHS